jgi:PREDICTED: RNA binding motif protein 10-like
MLKAMGWSEGQGLGRTNQGRSEIIEVEKRVSGVGLGLKSSLTMSGSGKSYKDAVRRAMQKRFQELSEKND